MHAEGEFEVNLQPLANAVAGQDGVDLGRMSIEKKFQGDLTASSAGEMLTALTTIEGSAGYVAIEQVTGTLHGLRGSFVLQHYGITHQGRNRLTLEVVPASGSGELAGLSGQMTIVIVNGKHLYNFEYQITPVKSE